jgi:hypothetical protein
MEVGAVEAPTNSEEPSTLPLAAYLVMRPRPGSIRLRMTLQRSLLTNCT